MHWENSRNLSKIDTKQETFTFFLDLLIQIVDVNCLIRRDIARKHRYHRQSQPKRDSKTPFPLLRRQVRAGYNVSPVYRLYRCMIATDGYQMWIILWSEKWTDGIIWYLRWLKWKSHNESRTAAIAEGNTNPNRIQHCPFRPIRPRTTLLPAQKSTLDIVHGVQRPENGHESPSSDPTFCFEEEKGFSWTFTCRWEHLDWPVKV